MHESRGNTRSEGRNQQHGQQDNENWQQGNQNNEQAGESAINMADIAFRGTAVLLSIQLDAVRSVFEMQARSAAAFGAPDYSGLFRSSDGGTKRLLAMGTHQFLSSARQANETISEMQRQFGRLIERRSQELSEEMRQSIEELSQRAREGLEQVKQMAEEGADEAERQHRQQRALQNTENRAQQQAGARNEEQGSVVEQPRPETTDKDRDERGKQRRVA